MVTQLFNPDDLMEMIMSEPVFDSSPASDILKDQSFHHNMITRAITALLKHILKLERNRI
jgi:hypothetical protein